MPRVRGMLPAVMIAFLATPLVSQERAVVFQVSAGGYNHLTNLNETGPDAHFKTGYMFGAEFGVDLNQYFGIRADASLARTKGLGAVAFANEIVNRYFLGGHVQLQYPFRQITPFVFGGAGAIRVDQQGVELDEDFEHFTRAAGVFGAGLSFDMPNVPVDIVAEGRATTYKWVAPPFSRMQWDVGYTVGFAYRFGF